MQLKYQKKMCAEFKIKHKLTPAKIFLRIEDNGIGMNRERSNAYLNAFYRAPYRQHPQRKKDSVG